METPKTYSTRSAAVRAARNACKKLLGSSFCAYEGPDYEIHPMPYNHPEWGYLGGDRYRFKLTGAWLEEIYP